MFGLNLFFYKMLFVLEIFVAEFLFTFQLKKRSYFYLRFAAGVAVILGIAAVIPAINDAPWYSSLTFIVIFASTMPVLRFCYRESWSNILFCSMAAYTLQHFAYEFANLVLSLIVKGKSPILGMYNDNSVDLFNFTKESVFYFSAYLMSYLISYSSIFCIFGRRIKKGRDMKIKSLSLLLLISAGLLANIVLNSFIIHLEIQFAVATILYFTNLLCCLLLLTCQFQLLRTNELQGELTFVQRLWHQEKEQYAISKENIDIINLKCHDMKHQVRNIGKRKSLEQETITEIENAISLYDSNVKTGNEPLDIILTEKSLRAHKNGITMTCVADGTLLDFMTAADIYSLFGNALDNAFEAVLKIKNSKARIVGFRIHAKGELVTININNKFDGTAITYDAQGLPRTTKEDLLYHGYGLKSIAFIVDKYDGNMTIIAEDGIFNLNILLPVPDKQ